MSPTCKKVLYVAWLSTWLALGVASFVQCQLQEHDKFCDSSRGFFVLLIVSCVILVLTLVLTLVIFFVKWCGCNDCDDCDDCELDLGDCECDDD